MIKPTCPRCRHVHATADAPAIGRFTPGGPIGYQATYTGAPIRATREEALEDMCRSRTTVDEFLPVEHPTVPGLVDGIVSLHKPTIQCQRCGTTHTERTIALAIILSGYRFHRGDNRRLCKACRLAEFPGCDCRACADDRNGHRR